MKILVLLAPVLDTEAKIKLNESKTAINTTGIQQVINPWDEFALTRALELKEQNQAFVESVTIATVGTSAVEPVMRKALAIGADVAYRIDYEPTDAFVCASQLTTIAQQFDLIITGVENSDYNGSTVGPMLAAMLNIESLGGVSRLDINQNTIIADCDMNGVIKTIEAPTPLLVVVQKGIAAQVRIANMRGIMTAKNKPLNVIAPIDCQPQTTLSNLNYPPHKNKCTMVDADNAAELIRLLREEARVL